MLQDNGEEKVSKDTKTKLDVKTNVSQVVS